MTALPSFFRDNYSADRVRRACVAWETSTDRCVSCGGVILHGHEPGQPPAFWACRDCAWAGLLHDSSPSPSIP